MRTAVDRIPCLLRQATDAIRRCSAEPEAEVLAVRGRPGVESPHPTITMAKPPPSSLDLALAKVCLHCPVCRQARRSQRGLAVQVVRKVERRVCPFCRAYERVYGRLAHAPRA